MTSGEIRRAMQRISETLERVLRDPKKYELAVQSGVLDPRFKPNFDE